MSTQDRYCEDRSYTIECPDLNAFALHEREHSSYPAVGHFSYIPKRDERLKGCVKQAAVGPRGSGGTLNMRYSAGETN